MQPFVSVLIPNYCHARFLDKRIQTVLNQTYDNFEVIILDDKSTDNSVEIIGKYKDNRHISHIVLNEHNSGSTFIQWQKGISLAKGDLIWIAESDDFCRLDMLKELVSEYEKYEDVSIVYSSVVFVDEEGKGATNNCTSQIYHFSGMEFIKRFMLYANPILNASSVLFSKAAALNISSYYEEFKGAGDYVFWMEIAAKGSVSFVDKELSYFRRPTNAVTNRKTLDGTNYFEERRILDYAKKKFNLSWFDLQSSIAFHVYRIRNMSYPFSSEAIREKVYNIWNFNHRFWVFDRLLNNYRWADLAFCTVMRSYRGYEEKGVLKEVVDKIRVYLGIGRIFKVFR